jgi:hypothetical protein
VGYSGALVIGERLTQQHLVVVGLHPGSHLEGIQKRDAPGIPMRAGDPLGPRHALRDHCFGQRIGHPCARMVA